MANINEELNEIKNATYGKDVRTSLHDGLYKINKETESTTARQVVLEETFEQLTINSGNSNSEIVAARVDDKGNSYETIGKRMNNFDSSLENKANEINSLTSNKVINIPKNENVSKYINDKIKEGYRTFCFNDEITLNETIVINDKSINVNFIGIGKNSQIDGNSPTIRLNTGGIGFKCVNSNNIKFENLSITTKNCINKSTIAIMFTRENVGSVYGSSQINIIDNVSIWLHDDMTCNNGEGTIGIYANTCEVTNFNNISVTANKPIVLTKRDIFKLTSNGYNQSMKDISFTGYTNLYSYGDTSLIVDGVVNLNVDNIYIGEINFCYTDNLFGVEFYDYNTNISMNIDCEHYNNVIGVFGRISNSRFNINSLRPKHVLHIGSKRNEKGIFSDNFITKSVTWSSDNAEQIDINNTKDGQGIYNSFFNGIFKVINNGVFENNLFLGASLDINTISGTQAPKYIHLKDGEILSNGVRFGGSYNQPTNNGEKAGSLILNTNQGGTRGNPVGWVYNGVSYIPFGQVGYSQSTTSPVGTLTPKQIGEEIFDVIEKHWYKSVGLTNTDWKRITE